MPYPSGLSRQGFDSDAVPTAVVNQPRQGPAQTGKGNRVDPFDQRSTVVQFHGIEV